MLNCRAIRDATKIEASQSLARKILDIDDQYPSLNNSSATTKKQPNQQAIQKPISIFDHLKDTPVKKINAKKWGT